MDIKSFFPAINTASFEGKIFIRKLLDLTAEEEDTIKLYSPENGELIISLIEEEEMLLISIKGNRYFVPLEEFHTLETDKGLAFSAHIDWLEKERVDQVNPLNSLIGEKLLPYQDDIIVLS